MSARFDAPHTGPGWGWIMLYGVVSVVLGLLAFAWPFAATLAATFVISCFFIAAGLVSIAAGVFAPGHEGRLYAIAFGILSLVVGVFMAARPISGAVSLTLLVEFWLMVRGVMEIGFGIRFRRHRMAMITLGVIDVLLALYILAMLPLAAMTLPGFILGLSFLFGGAVAIMQALAHRRGAAAFAVRE
ncbi:HdeD family acid-resistance protein [Sphingomonas sp.]|uniref:HdeD family acid-resistance protein n=1 Tax=Sphingomonas sp. TaxID=28214 RepID=UPI002C7C740A|nr:DUF308 domain-containing protein [Sphingomonas sp.]HWK35591.1 DUF308 domain-containing protein [Sphingomonas sp.]